MRLGPWFTLGLFALAAPSLPSCDTVTAGQRAESPDPPVLMKILIQDAVQPGRQVATDLLDRTPPLQCSERDPCPAGDRFGHPACILATGLCPHPLEATETAPPI